jgi:3',5'-cyclic AMP phosphodiesterase CpdA
MRPLTRTVLVTLFLTFPILIVAQKRADTISFLHITDIHFCNLTGYHPVIAQGRQHYGKAAEPLVNFFNSVPEKAQSDFVLITGDMIDFYEGETAKGDMLDTQVEQFARLLDHANVPVYLIMGNHDIDSYMVDSVSGRRISNQFQAGRARATWIRNVPCFRDGTYYSRTFQVDTTTYRLIFLDNAYYAHDRNEGSPFVMDAYQLYWLDNELKKSDTDIEIIFMHMPFFEPPTVDLAPSQNKYFYNLKDTVATHHELKSANSNIALYNVLKQNSSVRLIITGHLHSSVTHHVRLSDDYSLTQVMTGAFGRDSRNWRLIQLTSESIIISFPGNTMRQYTITLK